MSIRPFLSTLSIIMLLSGCSEQAAEQNTSSSDKKDQLQANDSSNSQTELAKPVPTEMPVVDEALLKKGKIAYLRCRSCHTTEKDGPHLTGPNLHGLFGATSGQKSGYAFSDALVSANIVWNTETLDAWIKQPSTYIPNNRMVFAGLPDAKDRAALIAFLAQETQ